AAASERFLPDDVSILIKLHNPIITASVIHGDITIIGISAAGNHYSSISSLSDGITFIFITSAESLLPDQISICIQLDNPIIPIAVISRNISVIRFRLSRYNVVSIL